MDHAPASLDDVLITAELARRPTRSADYAAENRALTGLAEAMSDSPQTILQKLVETALDLCRADSAGISISERGGAAEVFRWHAIAGQLSPYASSGVPREVSPCGTVLDRDASLLFAYPERHFDVGVAIDLPIVETLLVPFHAEGKPVGTLWVVAHTPSRQFDKEDERVLTDLSRFASMAYQLHKAALTAVTAREDVRQILDSADIGLSRCSRDLRYLECNRAYEKLTGLSTAQIVGRPIADVLGAKAFEVIRPYVERVLRGERVAYEEEIPVSLPVSGEVPRFFHVVYEPWYDSEGSITGFIASVSDLTALKRTTRALRESEERLRLAMSSGTIGVWDRDIVNDRYTLSPEVSEIFGVDPGSVQTYEGFRSRVHPHDLAAVESERDAAIRNREQFDLEFRIVRPSGEIRWLSARGRGHYDENGRLVRVAGINIDITERVKVKEALGERERRLKLALDASAGGSWTWDIGSNRVDWDDRFRKLYGFGREELATFDAWFSRVHVEDRQRVLGLHNEILHTNKADGWDCTFRIMQPDGNVSWIESRGRVERDAEGQAMRLTGLELDVTERRRAEEAQQEREQRLRLALDASMAGAWTWDHFTNQSRWDERFHAQYGFAEGAPQTFETWISSVHEKDRPRVLAHFDDLLHRHQNEWNIVFRAVRPDGTVRWMHGLGRADRDPDGQLTRVSGINLDITDRRRAEAILQVRRDEERERALQKQAEEALRRSHAELEQSHAELEQRTVQLSRLASQLTLAEQRVRKQLASTLHDGLQQLLFSAAITLDHAMQSNAQAEQPALLQRTRAVVKEAIEAARTLTVSLFPPVLHVGGLPAALKWLARRTQEQYGIVVNITADPQANPETSEVRILLFEGVRELLFNAVKHAQVPRVDLSLALGPDDTIHIEVSDEGIGFDPAATLRDMNQPQAGLGLFSIQERLALFGGHMDIVSAPGTGSRFILTLPRAGLPGLASDSTEPPRRDTERDKRATYKSAHGTSQSLRILIADDHAVVRAGLRELLSNRPQLQVVGEAANGVEAISHAKTLQPDVILMDIAMPHKNGIEATREILGTLPHIQIVGLSTYGDETTERAMREAGAQAYFSKTESTERLFDYILSLHPQAGAASGT